MAVPDSSILVGLGLDHKIAATANQNGAASDNLVTVTRISQCPGSDARSNRAELRRRCVMQAARQLFIENGFHATGMAQLAKTSGIAIGQIYRDFSAKEEIVAALVVADCERLMMYEVLEAAICAGDTAAVRGWLRDFVEPSDNPDDARMFAEILAESARSGRIAAIFRQVQDELRRHMDEALKLLCPADAVAPRRTIIAEVITTLSFGMFHQQLMRPDDDLADVVRGVKGVLDRELDALAAASEAALSTLDKPLCEADRRFSTTLDV